MAQLGSGLREVAMKDLHEDGSLSPKTRRNLIRAMRSNPFTVTTGADTSALDSATYTDATDLIIPVLGSRVYRVGCFVHLTQATSADGIKAQLLLTGTQTTAFANGSLIRFFDNGAGADATDMTVVAISSGAVTALSDADSAVAVGVWEFVLVPQNDGLLKVQYAEVADGGAAGAVLKKGSWLEVREISSRGAFQ
jgi:hypothetical protein